MFVIFISCTFEFDLRAVVSCPLLFDIDMAISDVNDYRKQTPAALNRPNDDVFPGYRELLNCVSVA